MEATVQVVPMTRFYIRVDCGGGPHCDAEPFSRVKLIARSWNPYELTAEDWQHWNSTNGCPAAPEASAWYSPPNCMNTSSGSKWASPCLLAGSTGQEYKNFGPVRILPKLESESPVAQIF